MLRSFADVAESMQGWAQNLERAWLCMVSTTNLGSLTIKINVCKKDIKLSTFSSYFDELWHRRKNHPTPQKSRQLKRIGSHNFIQKMQNCGEISNLQILVWHIRFKALSCPSKSHSFNEGEKNIPALGEGRCKSQPRTVIMRMVLLHKLIFSNDFLYVCEKIYIC